MTAVGRIPTILFQRTTQEVFSGGLKRNLSSSSTKFAEAKHVKTGYKKVLVIAGATTLLIYGLKRRRLLSCNFIEDQDGLIFKIFDALKLEFPSVSALRLMPKRHTEDNVLKGLKLNHRERRFMKFASVEHQGQLYMTPQDFIESVTDSEPRPRLKRRVLSENDIDRFSSETPSLSKGSPHMFRAIYDKGIVSYTEYLFLLSILTKPQTGFRIAFNMFDTDGNERVDKGEFLVLEKIFSTARKDRLNRAMEGVAKSAASTNAAEDNNGVESEEAVEDELQKKHAVDTTLLVHFFGKKGKQELTYEEFKTFMENLQTEVLEIEFNEFSKALPTISELDFAKILLRYTYLQSDQYEMYLERLLDRLPESKGITFIEFKSFCQFLNTLDDFAIAMKMYTLADQPISQDEFHRAVKICTGQELSPHIVDTVFKIFDDDGDGQLSYKEFIAIMRNRLHRGFKQNLRSEGWDAFKYCVKMEMKAAA